MRRLLLVLVCLAACSRGKKAGDKCSTIMPSASCKDEQTILLCEENQYIEVPCRGKGGCVEEPRGKVTVDVKCDISENLDGDRCLRPSRLGGGSSGLRIGGDENTGACSADRKAIVICTDGAYRRHACPGGCREEGQNVVCDDDGDSGEPAAGSAAPQ